MSIFTEVKEQMTARKAAEFYGLKVGRNGMACCPFHSDKHPSMKIDRNYHCFACGVGGDAVDYVSRMFGLSQLDAAKKLIEDFSLSVETEGNAPLDEQRKREIRKLREEEKRIQRKVVQLRDFLIPENIGIVGRNISYAVFSCLPFSGSVNSPMQFHTTLMRWTRFPSMRSALYT